MYNVAICIWKINQNFHVDSPYTQHNCIVAVNSSMEKLYVAKSIGNWFATAIHRYNVMWMRRLTMTHFIFIFQFIFILLKCYSLY